MNETKTNLPENYWDIIEKYHPYYHQSDEVMYSDILTRYIDDEEVCEKDLEWLPKNKEEAQKMLNEIDAGLFDETIDAIIQRMDWEHYREDLKVSIWNEHIWELGSDAGEECIHTENISRYEQELKDIESGNYRAVFVSYGYDMEVFESYMSEPLVQGGNMVHVVCVPRSNPHFYGRYYQLSKDVLKFIASILGNQTKDLSEKNYRCVVQDHRSGEQFVAMLESVSAGEFAADGSNYRLEDMNLADLCFIADNFATGEW